jgi:phospholipid transport system substrate-binding protein
VNGNLPPAEKQKRLRPIIDSAVDVDEVARFCLGRFWRVASPDQQKTYINLFHEVLVNSVTSKLGEYQGVKVTVGGSRQREDAILVASVVERPNNPASKVDWVISMATGSPKIVDVIAEGTSLRLTQRSDYAAFVTRNSNSVDALISAMKQQVAQQGG